MKPLKNKSQVLKSKLFDTPFNKCKDVLHGSGKSCRKKSTLLIIFGGSSHFISEKEDIILETTEKKYFPRNIKMLINLDNGYGGFRVVSPTFPFVPGSFRPLFLF